jgi:hypothetical protein
MTGALLWKEYRDQRAVWVTMVASAALFLVGVAQLADTEATRLEASRVVAVAFAWGYGLVCGALLLAGEREAGTLTFLDLLPASRMQLWAAKGLGGVLLVLLQVAAVGAIGYGFRLVQGPFEVAVGVILLVLLGLHGLAWGLWAGSVGRNVLNSVGLAVAGQVAASLVVTAAVFVVLVVVSVLTGRNEGSMANLLAGLSYPVLLFGATALSAALFTKTDRLRRAADPLPRVTARRRRPAPSGQGWGALLWLSWQQARRFVFLLALITGALGLLLPVNVVFLWPPLTLVVGTLCGVTVFADEQEQGAYRFLGEQRLPLGRVWLVKTGLRLAVAVGVSLLALVLGLIAGGITMAGAGRSMPNEFRQFVPSLFLAGVLPNSLWLVIREPWLFFAVWVAYGFAAGHLCGLLFRKTLVGFFAGLGVGGMLASVWAPSFLVGGLHTWQVFGVPLALLAVARLLMTPWAADRLVAWGTWARLAAAGVLAAAWTVGGVACRVAELPSGDETGMAQFLAGFPTVEENEGGRAMRAACRRLAESESALLGKEGMPAPLPPGQPRPRSIDERLGDTAEHGWPAHDVALAAALDQVFKDPWAQQLAEAADQPPGVMIDPRDLNSSSLLPELSGARAAIRLLGPRGLQRQAEGHPEEFVGSLHTGLALTRNLRNRSILMSALAARATESVLVGYTERWLDRLDGRPDLLRQALELWQKYPVETDADDRSHDLAECVALLNNLNRPVETVRAFLPRGYRDEESLRVETGVLGPAWQVPWERARLRRFVLLQAGDVPVNWRSLQELGPPFLVNNGASSDILRKHAERFRCRVEATRLMLALRLFQAETGQPAESLDHLIPKYLPAVPADPFDGKPFRYRLSRGERIFVPQTDEPEPQPGEPARPLQFQPGEPPGEPSREVPAGQGILWSVGEDRNDDGGHRQALPTGQFASAGRGPSDIIFLVPLPPRR